MSSSVFLSRKLIQGCLAIAFASNFAQLEMFSGGCGLNASPWHLPLVLLTFAAMAAAISLFLHLPPADKREKEIMITLTIIYGFSTLFFAGEVSVADLLLLEICFVSCFSAEVDWVYRFHLARVLLGLAYTKLTACGDPWESINSLKTSALNQPFPFTPVWHLAQVPDNITSIAALILLVSELLVPVFLVLTRSVGAVFSTLCLASYYGLIGNLNWTVTLMVACAIRLLPWEITTLILGSTTLKRWGFSEEQSTWNEARAESKLLAGLIEWAKLIGVTSIATFLLYRYIENLKMLDNIFWSMSASVLGSSLLLWTLFTVRTSPKAALLILIGIWFAGRNFASLVSLGAFKHVEDYSGLPTCYTFANNDDIGHSREGRSVYLFQTRFTQIGTNTVGRDLGGTRYAELSVPGSVHGDEVRPPFLMGHFPRVALKLWKIGTGHPVDVVEGIQLCRHLEKVVEAGSSAVRVFFSTADDSILSSMEGRKNQVQSFAQRYEVTNRVADHQWWKRSHEHVVALPTKHVASPYTLVQECAVIVPPKVFGVPMETVLLLGIVAAFVLRILFTSGKAEAEINNKKKKV